MFIQTDNLKIKIKVMPTDGIEPGYKKTTLDARDSASGEINWAIQNLQVITRVSRIYKPLQLNKF